MGTSNPGLLVLVSHPRELVPWNGWPVLNVNKKTTLFSVCRMEEELAAPSTSTDKTDRWDGSQNCQLANNTKSWSYWVKHKGHPSNRLLGLEFNSHVCCRCWKLLLTSGLHKSSAAKPFQGLIHTPIPAVLGILGFWSNAGEEQVCSWHVIDDIPLWAAPLVPVWGAGLDLLEMKLCEMHCIETDTCIYHSSQMHHAVLWKVLTWVYSFSWFSTGVWNTDALWCVGVQLLKYVL